ncbi:MAG TPA: PQQ-dependent sugar dehydrogenase [Patescibacteria group bacterium]|nr:PQQ-dependent sugar dehydrogenase [Patescibacteria group bacterium]
MIVREDRRTRHGLKGGPPVTGFVSIVSLLALLGVLMASPATAGVELVPVVDGLSEPVYVTHARDGSGRLFLVEQAGQIKVLQPGATTPTVFLDIRGRVRSFSDEQGLLGLAFHPQFVTNRRFFVNYTRQHDGATVIAEYLASATNPNLAEAAETVLLVVPQPYANHNGGMIEFGPDGLLYIGMGDGGEGNDPGNRAQNINELLGKILRIDVDHPNIPYSSPPDNPFGAVPGRDEIYALGLRNPWRFSFDRATNELYAADVGQNAFEEIDLVVRGGNYGWRVFEGEHCTNNDPALCNSGGFVPPIAEYPNAGARCAITGGYVYRGNASTLPVGSYVFGDFCSGEILLLSGGVQTVLLDTSLLIASFGEDEGGELYVVDLGGTVYRIANHEAPPTIGPDLIGTWNPVSQSCRKNRCKLRGSVRVVNQGNATAPASRLRILLSDDAVLDPSDTVLKESKIKKLKPGRGKTSKVKVTLPLGVNAAGKYLFALIDALHGVAELDETNNVSIAGPIP